MVTITLCTRQQKRHWCIEQSYGLCGEGEGGKIWENGIKTCIISCKKKRVWDKKINKNSKSKEKNNKNKI